MNTRITLTIPDELYQDAQRLAKRLNRDVVEVLSEAIRLETVAADVYEPPEIGVEREAFLKLHPALAGKFLGEYAAIHHGSLIDHDPDLGELAKRVRRDFPDRFVLIRQVLKEPEIVYQFRSPRLTPSF